MSTKKNLKNIKKRTLNKLTIKNDLKNFLSMKITNAISFLPVSVRKIKDEQIANKWINE